MLDPRLSGLGDLEAHRPLDGDAMTGYSQAYITCVLCGERFWWSESEGDYIVPWSSFRLHRFEEEGEDDDPD